MKLLTRHTLEFMHRNPFGAPAGVQNWTPTEESVRGVTTLLITYDAIKTKIPQRRFYTFQGELIGYGHIYRVVGGKGSFCATDSPVSPSFKLTFTPKEVWSISAENIMLREDAVFDLWKPF
jgi:hypothetical protein